MATNTTPIIFKITEAGKQAALAASDSSPKVQVNLTQVAIGSGKYTPTGNETALNSEIMRGALVSGDVESVSSTLRFSSSITSPTTMAVYEVGLLTDTGVLFAVAASPSDALFTAYPDITFVISYGLSLKDIDAENITVTTDPNGALSIVLIEQHLAAPNPHPQYVLQELYDQHIAEFNQHIIDNNDEHTVFRGWQKAHISADDPHSQYVLRTTYDNKVDELVSRLNMLAEAIGNNVVEGDYSVALLTLHVQHKRFLGEGFSRTQITKTQENGLLFADYTTSIPVSQSEQYSRNYNFVITLPESYDPAIHRIVAFGGNTHRIEGSKVIFGLATQVETYTYNPGGDNVEETGYRSTIDATVQVEMFSKLPPPPPSGALVGLLNITLTDTARSADDVSGNGRVTVNNTSGFPFGYPSVINLAKPTTNAPLDYQLTTKILLPVEYKDAEHDLIVSNTSGSYFISQADRSISFNSTVASVKQSDNEVLDTLDVTFHIEVRNK